MRFSSLAALSSLVLSANAAHGDGYEGTIMGPVQFLWPGDRAWSAAADNIAPCGSTATITNRTNFPLSQGAVALAIADAAYSVAVHIAFNNNPTSQSDFSEEAVNNVTEIVPGHQCYKIDPIPSTIKAGTNATIQLVYSATYAGENNGKNETFYACADITFVEDRDFNFNVPCFNVTKSGFDSGNTATVTATSAASTSTNTSAPSRESGGNGLSKGQIAGIAVGVVVGSLAIVGAVAFVLLRRRRAERPAELPLDRINKNPETGSVATNN